MPSPIRNRGTLIASLLLLLLLSGCSLTFESLPAGEEISLAPYSGTWKGTQSTLSTDADSTLQKLERNDFGPVVIVAPDSGPASFEISAARLVLFTQTITETLHLIDTGTIQLLVRGDDRYNDLYRVEMSEDFILLQPVDETIIERDIDAGTLSGWHKDPERDLYAGLVIDQDPAGLAEYFETTLPFTDTGRIELRRATNWEITRSIFWFHRLSITIISIFLLAFLIRSKKKRATRSKST